MAQRKVSLVSYANPSLVPDRLKKVAIVPTALNNGLQLISPNWITDPSLTPADQVCYGATQYASLDLVPPGIRILGLEEYVKRVQNLKPIFYAPMAEQSGTGLRDEANDLTLANAYTGVTFNQPGVNLIQNPGFETAGAGAPDVFGSWAETAGDGTIEAEASIVHGGAKAAKLTAGATPGASPSVKQSIVVNPGQLYTWTYWTRGDGTNAGRHHVWDNTNSAHIVALATTGVSGNSFQQVTVTFAAPAGCLSLQLELYCPNVQGGIVYFDDVSVVAASPNGIGDGRNAPFFDGTNDFCNIYSAGLAAAFNGAEGTLSIWAKVSAADIWTDGLDHYIAIVQADTNNQISIRKRNPNNDLRFVVNIGGASYSGFIATSTTAWFHVAVTWSDTNDVVRHFFNGAQIGADVPMAAHWAGALAPTQTVVGAVSINPTTPWSGLIAHPCIFNRALASYEIASLAGV